MRLSAAKCFCHVVGEEAEPSARQVLGCSGVERSPPNGTDRRISKELNKEEPKEQKQGSGWVGQASFVRVFLAEEVSVQKQEP